MQFIREHTSKVDDLVKDKLDAFQEVKSKEKEEKNLVAQQVASEPCIMGMGQMPTPTSMHNCTAPTYMLALANQFDY